MRKLILAYLVVTVIFIGIVFAIIDRYDWTLLVDTAPILMLAYASLILTVCVVYAFLLKDDNEE